MMTVGEQGGRMGEMMDRIARFYDEETARFVDAFTRVFEPLLMAVLGLAVGAVVVLMYMPVFELAGSLQ
jgi:general secretion pathway protein F